MRRERRLAIVLGVLLPAVILIALRYGVVELGWPEVLAALNPFTERGDTAALPSDTVVQRIRLPRALMAAMVGAMLAACGTVTQGLFRNPLADPSLIGVTAGASLGASLVIVTAGGAAGLYGAGIVGLGAFCGGLVSVLLVYRLATGAEGTSVATMLLAGIAVTALTGAIGSLLELHSSDSTLRRISLWRMGGLEGASADTLALALPLTLLVLLPLPRFAQALDAMLLGESEARYLGIAVERVKSALIVLVAIGVGASVALAGTIAFVGLVVPHMVRLVIGPAHRALLPLSALAGAILLVAADTLARTVLAPSELPVGVVTALLGVPFFISLLRRQSRFGMQ